MAEESTAQTTTQTATDLASYQQFALEQQAQNNAWSAEQAQKQMDFQREMSNSAHQREVADLKAAGLNPILSVNSGASVPNGAAGDTDTSAAGNVGAILQQVLQAQSAREVAGMYNAATIAAATIAANASMYGSDMSYWNKEDHPTSAAEYAAWQLAQLNGGSHAPGTGSSPHDIGGSGSSGSSSNFVQDTVKDVLSAITGKPKYSLPQALHLAHNKWAQQNHANFLKLINGMSVKNRLRFNSYLVTHGVKRGISGISGLSLTQFLKLYTNFVKGR